MMLELSLETIKSQVVKSAKCIASFKASPMHLGNAAAHVNSIVRKDQESLGCFPWSTVCAYEIEDVMQSKTPKTITSKKEFSWFLLAREESPKEILITIARVEYSYE